jgi:hypothetical protein
MFLFLPLSPEGRKFRSKPQIIRYLGESADLSMFDFSSKEGTVDTRRRTARDRTVKPKVYTPRVAYSDERPLSVHPLRPSGPIRRTCGVIKLPIVWTPPKKEVPPELQNGTDTIDGHDTPLGAIVQRQWERRLAMSVVAMGGYYLPENPNDQDDATHVVRLVNGSLVKVDAGSEDRDDYSDDGMDSSSIKSPLTSDGQPYSPGSH